MSKPMSMLEEAVANGWRVLATADGHFALTHNGSLVVDLVPPAGGEGWGSAPPALIVQSSRRGIVGVGEAHDPVARGVIGEGKGSGASGYLVGDGGWADPSTKGAIGRYAHEVFAQAGPGAYTDEAATDKIRLDVAVNLLRQLTTRDANVDLGTARAFVEMMDAVEARKP